MIQKEMLETLKKIDEAMDADLVSYSVDKMAESMQHSREDGKTQWWNPTLCPQNLLEERLKVAVSMENWTAARNYAAMLEYRAASGI